MAIISDYPPSVQGKDNMQIRKTYYNIKPELLFDELKDLVVKQGVSESQAKMETYSLPEDSSSHIARGIMTFNTAKGSECLKAHIIGSARGETKLMLDIDEKLLPQNKVSALQEDLDFVFGSYEVK